MLRPLLLLLLPASLGAVPLSQSGEQFVQTFEGDGFGDWQLSGEAFGKGPAVELPPELNGTVSGYSEESFGSSARNGLTQMGELESPSFVLKNPYLSFLIAGLGENVGLEMQVEGKVIFSAKPRKPFALQRVTWDVSPWKGQAISFRLFDESESGFIILDHLISHSYANPVFPRSTREGQPYEPNLISSPAAPGMLLAKELTASVFADHQTHQVYSPTALSVSDNGQIYVVETHRFRAGVEDNRDFLYWVGDDIASRTTDDRQKMYEKWQHKLPLEAFTKESEVVRLLEDNNSDDRADQSSIFADGFNDLLDGTGAGIFTFDDQVYLACIPNIYSLEDHNHNGSISTEEKEVIADGFGVRVSLSGHDLNGFTLGPDGRIYGTMGDRGLSLITREGVSYQYTDQGVAFRFEPDGSKFEIFHTGLRNPKELAFNTWGDAFSVDNNADMGDLARLVYLVDGADSGWRTDHQTMHSFHRQIGLPERPGNLWMEERRWDLANDQQPSWLIPPIENLSNGPSGLTYQPGTALGGLFADHFLLCDYKGGPSASGIHAFTVTPEGSSYQIAEVKKFAWGIGVTDLDFGPNGNLYLTDFGTGWKSDAQGQVLVVAPTQPHEKAHNSALLFAEGFPHRSEEELAALLSHPDLRIRLRSQLALAKKPKAHETFHQLLFQGNRLKEFSSEQVHAPELRHAIWGLSWLARHKNDLAASDLLAILQSPHPELRAQSAKGLGESSGKNTTALISALRDPSSRVRFFAALSLGRLQAPEAADQLVKLALHAGKKNDPYLRHAAVQGLAGCLNENELLKASSHPSPHVRLASLLVLRQKRDPRISQFLSDSKPSLQTEAIRIIHDTPIESARPALLPLVDRSLQGNSSPLSAPIWRRLVFSVFRLGGTENAARLITIANSPQVPLHARKQALELLKQWTTPHPVDQSLGRHAPLSSRPLNEIQPLLENRLGPLLKAQSPTVTEALSLIAHYQLSPQELSTEALHSFVTEQKIPPAARATALTLIAKNDQFSLPPLLLKLLETNSTPPSLKLVALELFSKREPEKSFPYLEQALKAKNLTYRQGAVSLLASYSDPRGATLVTKYFNDLTTGQKRDRKIELEMTSVASLLNDPIAEEALNSYRKTLEETPLGPYQKSLFGGNRARGKALFESHPVGQCSRCHSRAKNGSAQNMAGPNLSKIGKNSEQYLLESLLFPSAQIASGYAPIQLTLNNGTTLSGPLLESAPDFIKLTVEGKARQISRDEIKETSKPVSPMPTMKGLLEPHELRDLVTYLKSLSLQRKNAK